MAEKEAPRSNQRSDESQMFAPYKFFVSFRVPDRQNIIKKIEANGAIQVKKETLADYCIVNPAAPNATTIPNALSPDFVLDSLRLGELQDAERYRITAHPLLTRPVGSILPKKGTRTPYSQADDQILWNWITPFRDQGGSWQGNAIYQQLERRHPHHTYQSWRSRYIDHVQHKKGFGVTEHVNYDEHPEHGKEGRCGSPKRRRLNGSSAIGHNETRPMHAEGSYRRAQLPKERSPESRHQRKPTPTLQRQNVPPADELPKFRTPSCRVPLTKPDHQQQPLLAVTAVAAVVPHLKVPSQLGPRVEEPVIPPPAVYSDARGVQRQNLSTSRFTKTDAQQMNFTLEEAQELYRAVPEIHSTSPDKLDESWNNMAQLRNSHLADAWRSFYESTILPEYKRRNRLQTNAQLDDFIQELLVQENRAPTPVKREHTPDLRSPEERQRARKAHLARVETLDIVFSDASSQNSNDDVGAVNADAGRSELQARQRLPHEPQSPTTYRASSVHANESRKRTSQQDSNTQSTTQPSQDVVEPPSSQKKKLFGRKLDLSQSLSRDDSRLNTQPMLFDGSTNQGSALPPSSIMTSSENTNVVSSSSSLPTAYKPPHSYQIPPASASTSQESAGRETIQQGSLPQIDESAGECTDKQSAMNALKDHTAGTGLAIYLLDDDAAASDGDDEFQSLAPSSDTGSEYMAFDTAPEKSQLWDDTTDATGLENADEPGDADKEDEELGKAHTMLRPTRLQALSRRRIDSEQTTDKTDSDQDEGLAEDAEAESMVSNPEAYVVLSAQVASHMSPVKRPNTQALFDQLEQEEDPEFDVPSPDGGWSALGLDNLYDADPDTALQTVELADDDALKHKRSSPLSSRTDSSNQPDEVHHSPVSNTCARPQLGSSGATETTDAEDHEPINLSVTKISPPDRVALRQSQDFRQAPTQHLSKQRLAALSDSEHEGLIDSRSTMDWMSRQQQRYSELPLGIIRRLRLHAHQASNRASLSKASLTLEYMVDAYKESEKLRHDDKRKRKRKFKPRETISRDEAKALIPRGRRGVWTPADDNDLLSGASARLRAVEVVHGIEGKTGRRARSAFLRDLNIEDAADLLGRVRRRVDAEAAASFT